MEDLDLASWTAKPQPKTSRTRNPHPGERIGQQESLGAINTAEEGENDDVVNHDPDFGSLGHFGNPDADEGTSSRAALDSTDMTRNNITANRASNRGAAGDTGHAHKRDSSKQDAPVTADGARATLTIHIPRLSEADKQEYTYLPGHFAVKKIRSQTADGRYVIELRSGEESKVTLQELLDLDSGEELLQKFKHGVRSSSRRQNQRPSTTVTDWTSSVPSESEQEAPQTSDRRATRAITAATEAETESSVESDAFDEIRSSRTSSSSRPTGRRSARLSEQQRKNYIDHGMQDLPDEDRDLRRSGRGRLPEPQPSRSGRQRGGSARHHTSLESSPGPDVVVRRSERAKMRPRRSMRERQEDEISSAEEEAVAQKVLGVKEHFTALPGDSPFRRRHRQDCDTCQYAGDDPSKGPLVFCQGCTNSYHKACLGPRGSRDHLVTKVGEGLFVLQCRRCIGVSHEKDPAAPHQGLCATCHEMGELGKPHRNIRLNARQEQTQREENGGKDPIVIVDPDTINNPAKVMFRCATCSRAWHLHHLPRRGSVHSISESGDDEVVNEEEAALDEAELGQRRFDYYHRSWTCKDCVENPHVVDSIVAWRPIDIDRYVPGTPVDMLQEEQKEYLLKWRAQSYFRTTWMPGTWVWGLVANQTRIAFMRRAENRLPKMTSNDAIPEEYFRIDIVFDVRYSSVVRNSSREIDLARAKEVETAYVKYKGLGYEDAIWEVPPASSDTERWNDFKDAYTDYVVKWYVSIPVQSSLRRHLISMKTQDFESTIIKRDQPSVVTGGEMMRYQIEGLNWLLFQWFQGQNAILADEMGLGKTIQIVSFMATLIEDHKCWPLLVVVPNSTCPNWRREIKRWVPGIRVVTYYGSSVARKLVHDYELFPKDREDNDGDDRKPKPVKRTRNEPKDIKAHVVVTSYESIVEEKTRKSLMRVPWQALVVDEGQRLKNDKNQIYDLLSKSFKFPFKVLLTGTPLQNNARELFNLLQFLDKSMSASELEAKYANNLTQETVQELHDTLRKFILRRTKAQVLTFLPPMAQIILPVTMSTVQKKVYKSILARNPTLMKSIFSRESATGKERMQLSNILMQLRKTLCHPFVYSREIEERTANLSMSHQNLVDASSKLRLLSIMMPKLKERGHRVLIFSQFLDNLDVVEDFLDGLGLQHLRLDGTITAMEKQKRIDKFNAPDSPHFAFLLSTRAGGVGINLATADTVIIMDPDFNPHQDIQALSRAHRIGQKQKVLVFQLMTRDSVEEKIMQIGKKKMALDHVLIERMDREDDEGIDLESILRHGAQALFEDSAASTDIDYDSASVDRLLDRSQVEDTKTSNQQSAESQFSFARVWANDKSTFENDLPQTATGTNTPNTGIWDRILQERERVFAEEQAKHAEALGRGKRKRQRVNYSKGEVNQDAHGEHDTNYELEMSNSGSDDKFTGDEDEPEPSRRRQTTTKARPFRRVKVPMGQAPNFNSDEPPNLHFMDGLPPMHYCSACGEQHPKGWCRLKLAGVEHCGLCGLAHLGYSRVCPHLSNETQVATLLQTLKESTESRQEIEEATKYLRMVRGNMLARKRARERKEQEAATQQQAGEGNHSGNGLEHAQAVAERFHRSVQAVGGEFPAAAALAPLASRWQMEP